MTVRRSDCQISDFGPILRAPPSSFLRKEPALRACHYCHRCCMPENVRGCEKMFNHFFTASFLCISLWLHSNEEEKMVIIPPYPHKMRLFLFMQFLVVVSAYGSIYLGFGQWQSNKSPVSLFSCSGVEYVCSRGHFLRFKRSLLTGWIGSSLKRRL